MKPSFISIYCAFFLTLLTLTLTAQVELHEGHGFSTEADYRLLADAVNVRDQADTKGNKIAQLAIATEVTLVEISDKKLLINGLNLPWCKISFIQAGKKKEGYVWLGFLALAALEFDEKDHGFLLVGHGKGINNRYQMQVRLSKNNTELDRIYFEHSDMYLPEDINLLEDKGLEKVDQIFQIACPFQSWASEEFVILNKDKLYYLGELGFSWDSPGFQEEAFLFPKDEGGKYNRIIWTHRSGEMLDNGEDDYVTEKRKEYLWTGEVLIDMDNK